MKKLLFFLLILVSYSLFSQDNWCESQIDYVEFNGKQYLSPDTINICAGTLVYISANALCFESHFSDDFNSGSLSNNWVSNCSPMFNNPCGDGPDGSTYLWIGDSSNFPRELTLGPLYSNNIFNVFFDMKYGVQGEASPCEGPDLATEGVHLQWASNLSGPWTSLNYYHPMGGYDPFLTQWNNYNESFSYSGNIWVRWYQNLATGHEYDHWGLDNINIFTLYDNSDYTLTWDDGDNIISNNVNLTITPTQSATYTLTAWLNPNTYSKSQVHINIIEEPEIIIEEINPVYSIFDTVITLSASPPLGYFSGPGLIAPNIFSPSDAGTGTHNIYYNYPIHGTNKSIGYHEIFFDNFSSDLGWTGYGQGGWERSVAIGGGNCTGPDNPSEDYTQNGDNMHIGTFMGECYENNMDQTYYLTSPIINTEELSLCQLEFWSHSACQDRVFQDIISVETYNGTSWETLWMNPSGIPLIGGQNYTESTWTLHSHDIPNATNNPNFQIRFGIGPTNASTVYKGWNIDDVKVTCYGVKLISDTLCEVSDYISVTVSPFPVNINENEFSQISIYPNPAGDFISISSIEQINTAISITDITGKTIIKSEINGLNATIDISMLKPGEYLINIDNKIFKLIVR